MFQNSKFIHEGCKNYVLKCVGIHFAVDMIQYIVICFVNSDHAQLC
jgi:hypothetical protein